MNNANDSNEFPPFIAETPLHESSFVYLLSKFQGKEIPLLLLDDEYLLQFLEWSTEQGISNLILFLLETDCWRFNVEVKNSKAQFEKLLKVYFQNGTSLTNFIPESVQKTIDEIFRLGIPFHCGLAVVCEIIWEVILSYDFKVGSSFRKRIVGDFKLDFHNVVRERNLRKYFEKFLTEQNSIEHITLAIWKESKSILNLLEKYKIHSQDDLTAGMNVDISLGSTTSSPSDLSNTMTQPHLSSSNTSDNSSSSHLSKPTVQSSSTTSSIRNFLSSLSFRSKSPASSSNTISNKLNNHTTNNNNSNNTSNNVNNTNNQTSLSPLTSSISPPSTSPSAASAATSTKAPRRRSSVSSPTDSPEVSMSASASISAIDAEIGGTYSDPYKAVKIALKGVRNLHQSYFLSQQAPPPQSSTSTSSVTSSSNPSPIHSSSLGSNISSNSHNSSALAMNHYYNSNPSLSVQYGQTAGSVVSLSAAAGVSEATRIEIAATLDMTCSVRDVEALEPAFVRVCLGRLDRILHAIEKQTFQKLQLSFPAFTGSDHFLKLSADRIAKSSKSVQSYLQNLRHLYQVASAGRVVFCSSPSPSPTKYLYVPYKSSLQLSHQNARHRAMLRAASGADADTSRDATKQEGVEGKQLPMAIIAVDLVVEREASDWSSAHVQNQQFLHADISRIPKTVGGGTAQAEVCLARLVPLQPGIHLLADFDTTSKVDESDPCRDGEDLGALINREEDGSSQSGDSKAEGRKKRSSLSQQFDKEAELKRNAENQIEYIVRRLVDSLGKPAELMVALGQDNTSAVKDPDPSPHPTVTMSHISSDLALLDVYNLLHKRRTLPKSTKANSTEYLEGTSVNAAGSHMPPVAPETSKRVASQTQNRRSAEFAHDKGSRGGASKARNQRGISTPPPIYIPPIGQTGSRRSSNSAVDRIGGIAVAPPGTSSMAAPAIPSEPLLEELFLSIHLYGMDSEPASNSKPALRPSLVPRTTFSFSSSNEILVTGASDDMGIDTVLPNSSQSTPIPTLTSRKTVQFPLSPVATMSGLSSNVTSEKTYHRIRIGICLSKAPYINTSRELAVMASHFKAQQLKPREQREDTISGDVLAGEEAPSPVPPSDHNTDSSQALPEPPQRLTSEKQPLNGFDIDMGFKNLQIPRSVALFPWDDCSRRETVTGIYSGNSAKEEEGAETAPVIRVPMDFRCSTVIESLDVVLSVKLISLLLMNSPIVLLSSSPTLLSMVLVALPDLCYPFVSTHDRTVCITEETLMQYCNHKYASFEMYGGQSTPTYHRPHHSSTQMATAYTDREVQPSPRAVCGGKHSLARETMDPHFIGIHTALYRSILPSEPRDLSGKGVKGSSSGRSLKLDGGRYGRDESLRHVYNLLENSVVVDIDSGAVLTNPWPNQLEMCPVTVDCPLFGALNFRLKHILTACRLPYTTNSRSLLSRRDEAINGTTFSEGEIGEMGGSATLNDWRRTPTSNPLPKTKSRLNLRLMSEDSLDNMYNSSSNSNIGRLPEASMEQQNEAIRWSFRCYLGDVILHALPASLQHYPREEVIACDIDKFLDHIAPSYKNFCIEVIDSPVFSNLLTRHGLVLGHGLPPPRK